MCGFRSDPILSLNLQNQLNNSNIVSQWVYRISSFKFVQLARMPPVLWVSSSSLHRFLNRTQVLCALAYQLLTLKPVKKKISPDIQKVLSYTCILQGSAYIFIQPFQHFRFQVEVFDLLGVGFHESYRYEANFIFLMQKSSFSIMFAECSVFSPVYIFRLFVKYHVAMAVAT